MVRRFEWDPEKDRANLAKHGLTFALAQRVFDDPFMLLLPDRVVDGEERWHAIGIVAGVTVLTVVHLYPEGDQGDDIRIISARKATRGEQRSYDDLS